MGQLCTEILMRPERRHGVERAKRNKPHRQKKKSKYAFAKTTYIHRKQGTTKWAGFRIPTLRDGRRKKAMACSFITISDVKRNWDQSLLFLQDPMQLQKIALKY